MVNLRQDPVPESMIEPASPPVGEGAAANGPAAARGIVLSVRLRIPDRGGSPPAVSWAADSPAAAMVIDIIDASGGAADPPQGGVLQARFFNLQSALIAARRLQWALEGLAESSGTATAAAISIHGVEDPVAESVKRMLEGLMPGQVLLSTRLAEAVQQLPGLTLRSAGAGNWHEVLWPPQAGGSPLEADEQSLLGLIHALGRQDPAPPRIEEPTPAAAPPVIAPSDVFEAPASLGRSFEEPETAPVVFWKRPWVVVSAGAGVVVLLAALIVPAMLSGGHSKSSVPNPAVNPVPPPGTHGPPPDVNPPPPPEKSPDPKQAPKSAKPKTPIPGPAPETPVARTTSASCDLAEGDIPRSISRAESLMYAGRLEEAQDAYQRLVGCPSAREKALAGLRIVKQRLATQSP